MEQKNGFVYIYSEVLKQKIAYSEKTGKFYCEDGTVYTKEEVEEIKKIYNEIPMSVHIIKRNFGGQIIEIKDKENENE